MRSRREIEDGRWSPGPRPRRLPSSSFLLLSPLFALLRPRSDEQADARHSALCAVAPRLLAAPPIGNQKSEIRNQKSLSGKNPFSCLERRGLRADCRGATADDGFEGGIVSPRPGRTCPGGVRALPGSVVRAASDGRLLSLSENTPGRGGCPGRLVPGPFDRAGFLEGHPASRYCGRASPAPAFAHPTRAERLECGASPRFGRPTDFGKRGNPPHPRRS